MRGSPGLLASIHALILGSLRRRQHELETIVASVLPFVLFADIIPFTQVDKVGDGFGGEESQPVDHINLEGKKSAQISNC